MRKEILTLKEKELGIEVAGNKVSSLKKKNITKSSARYFSQNKIYATSFIGEIDDEDLLDKAINNSAGALDYPYELQNVSSVKKEFFCVKKKQEDLLPEYQSALTSILKKHPNFIFSGKAKFKRIKKTLHFLDEALLENSYDYCEWYFLYKHKSSANIFDGHFGSSNIGDFDIISQVNKYSEFLTAYSNDIKITPGKYPVIFINPSQLFFKILENAKADIYYQGIGLFKNQLNKKIFHKDFTLFDVSYNPSIGATSLFDAEGYQRNQPELAIIKKGVFNSLITDQRNARKYALELTGNTQRTFDSSSKLGFNTITLAPGKRSLQQILNEIPQCLVVEMGVGGDFTDLGNYSTPVQSGFFIENGRVKGRLPQITLNSCIEKIFGEDFIEIANKPFFGNHNPPTLITQMDVLVN